MPKDKRIPVNWITVTESQYPWEIDALRFIQEKFPVGADYHAWSNFEFIGPDGSINEIDLLVASPWGLFLVEIKSRPGKLTGDNSVWTWTTPDGRRCTVDNPLILANRKSKRLKSALAQQPSVRKVKMPFIQPLVFCSANDLEIRLPEDARSLLALRDDLGPSVPGIRAALFRRECPGLQKLPERLVDGPTLRAFAQAMADAGLRRKKRKVSDFILDDLRYESPAGLYQDWLAHHSVDEATRRLVRVYLLDSRRPEHERSVIKEMALREYRVLERLNHANILKALVPGESELGPAIIFGFDPTAQRLDHFLAENASNLDVGQRLELLRQIADAVRYAHDKKVLHRSLSPQSIFVLRDKEGRPRVQIYNWQTATKLADGSFSGLTHLTLTQHGFELVDDPARAYLAPEGFASDEEPREEVDVFSLGALAYLIFGGQPPARDAGELIEKLRDSATRSLDLRQIIDAVPDSIATLVKKSARSAPAERCSVEDFIEGLDSVLEELTRPEHEVADPRDASKGDILSNGYQVERQLGRGASSIALLVTRGQERRVLKVAREPSFNQRLREEFAILKKLSFPNIVVAHDPFEFSAVFGFTLELAGEQTLARSLKEDGIPDLEFLQRYGEELLKTVEFLDEQGVFHRDIKPENIGIMEGGAKGRKRLRLFDFSLAAAPPAELRVGTQEYLDPFLEQRKARRYDLSAELYAAAITLHEMATGARPSWSSGHPLATTDEISIRTELFDPNLRDKFAGFFTRALRRDYQKRFDNAREMLRAWSGLFETVDLPSFHDTPGHYGDANEVAPAHLLDSATPLTQLTFLGLSTRLMNFLERQGIATVTDLLRYRYGRFEKFRGVGRKTQRELLAVHAQLRQKFPEIEGEQTSGTAASLPPSTVAGPETIEAAAQHALLVKKGKAGETESEVLYPYLGWSPASGEDPLDWPGQSDLAIRAKVSRQRVGQLVVAARQRWAQSGILSSLRETILEILNSKGGVTGHRELVAQVIAARGAAAEEPERTMLGSAAVRAALDAESLAELPRFTDYRSADRILVTVHPALKCYAFQLGRIADRLADEDPLPAPTQVAEQLRSIQFPENVPDLLPPNDLRLRQLAVLTSTSADLSSRGEIYPIGLDAQRTLLLSRNALFGEELTPEEIGRRIKARFPRCETLPPRPALDSLLIPAGLEWDPLAAGGAGAYRTHKADSSSLTYSLGSRLHTRNTLLHSVATDPDLAEAESIEDRLRLSRKKGGYLVLTVHPAHLDRAREEIESRFEVDSCDLDALLLDALRTEADRIKAKWEIVLAADATEAGSADWRRLQSLVDKAMPSIEAKLRTGKRTKLLLYPGLFARYGRMGTISTLVADIGRSDGPWGIWVLAPEHGANPLPMIAGQPIPIINAAHHTRLSEHWLRNAHRSSTP